MFGGGGFGGFGSNNNQQTTQPSLFGAANNQQQQQPAQTGFGGFGQTAQPAAGGFGAASNPPAGGGLFGAANTSTPGTGFGFGQTAQQPAAPAAGGGLFGAAAKPATSGFGGFGTNTTTPAAGGLGGFGSTQPQTNAFGAGSNAFGAKPAGTGLFGSAAPATGGFGAMNTATTQAVPSTGTLNPPYQPTTMSEKDAHGNPVNMCYTTITCMPAYQKASQEELRVQDYLQGRKTGQTGPGAPGNTQGAGFGGFGNTANTMGQPAQPAGGNLFGQTNTAANTGGGLFGQANNATNAGGGLFGNNNAGGNTGGGLFGQQNKPAAGGGLFGQNNAAQPATGGGLFGAAKPAGTGFGFGNTGATNAGTTGFGGFGANNNNAATTNTGGGLFGGGGFGQQNNQQQQPSTGFGFGQQPQQQQNNAFGANNTAGGGLLGQNKPAGTGLFGNTGAANTTGTGTTGFGGFGANANTQAPKPAFGGFGATNTAGQPGQPGGGLFGNTGAQTGQSGGLFGNNNTNNAAGGLGANQAQTGTAGGGLFGGGASTNTGGGLFGANTTNNQAQPAAQTSGLFGQKPAAPAGGGLFGQSNTANTGGGLFGNNNASTNTGGGLFGQNNANQSKPAFGANAGTGLFGNTSTTQPTAGAAPGGGLFGQNNQQQQSGLGGGLFGQKPAGASTFGQQGGLGASTLGGAQNNAGAGGGLFGQSMMGTSQAPGAFGQSQQPQMQAPPTLTTNPYGTDALFGSSISAADLNNNQPVIPFNVAPKSAKKPPLVPSVFSSPRNQTSITRLRGATPGASMSRAREGTPFGDGSMSFSRSRMGSAGPSLFRGLSDEQALSPRAFVPKPSAKRLVLDDSVDASNTSFSRVLGQRNARAATAAPEDRPSNRNVGLAASATRLFSPALETSARRRAPPALGDDTFNSNASMEDTPLRRRFDAGNRASSAMPRIPAPMPPLPAAGDASALEPEGDLPMGYYMRPSLSELRTWAHAELASVRDFVVGRTGYGEVAFDKPVDLTAVPDLTEIAGGIILIRHKELIVYPEEDEVASSSDGVLPGYLPCPSQPRGSGLNQPATVSLDGCWALDKSTKAPIKDPNHPRYKQHLNRIKSREGTKFVSFDAETGSWRFKVEHFSRYALDSESDEDDDAEDAHAPQTAPGQSFSKPVAAGARPQAHARATADESEDDVMEDDETLDEDEESPPPAAPGPVSFAEAMHVEPRRMQVMQASLFGDQDDRRPPVRRAGRLGSTAPADESKLLFQQSVFRNGPPTATPAPVTTAKAATPIPTAGSVRSHSVREGSVREGSLPPVLVPSTARPNFGAKSALTAQPRIKFIKTSMDKSVLLGAEGTWADPVVALTGSFRPGFGFPNLLVRVGAQKDVDVATASQVKVLELPPAEDELALKMLAAQLQHTTIDFVSEDGVPEASPKSQLRFRDFASLFEAGDRHQEAHIWRLGSALFDDLELGLPDSAPAALRREATDLRRKAALSKWLKKTVTATAEAEARGYQAQDRVEALIFSHLTSHDVEKATLAAMGANEFHLATLLAQMPGDQGMREDLQEQLVTWRDEGVYPMLSDDMRKLYELLAGNVTLAEGAGGAVSGDKVSDMLLADSLDWKRAFGLHLWYGTLFEEPLSKAVSTFDAATASALAPPPLPPYLADETSFPSPKAQNLVKKGKYAKDTLYKLLKVYAEPEYLLEDAILPTGHSKSSSSYRLSWQLYLLLSRVLGVRDFADRAVVTGAAETVMEDVEQDDVVVFEEKDNSARADQLTLDLASQLEAGGHFQWAVFVLLFIELRESRVQAIKNLLARSIHLLTSEQEEFIVTTLKVPRSWLALARAFVAQSKDDLWGVYECLIEADDLAQAHAIAARDLAPEVVVRGDRDLLKKLFEPFLVEAGKGDEDTVPGWSCGGKLYLDWVNATETLTPLLYSLRRQSPSTAHPVIQSLSSRISELATLIPTVLLPEEEDKSTPGALTRYAAKIDMMATLGIVSRALFRYTYGRERARDEGEVDASWSLAAASALEGAATVEQHQPTPSVDAVLTAANDYCSLLVAALA